MHDAWTADPQVTQGMPGTGPAMDSTRGLMSGPTRLTGRRPSTIAAGTMPTNARLSIKSQSAPRRQTIQDFRTRAFKFQVRELRSAVSVTQLLAPAVSSSRFGRLTALLQESGARGVRARRHATRNRPFASGHADHFRARACPLVGQLKSRVRCSRWCSDPFPNRRRAIRTSRPRSEIGNESLSRHRPHSR